MQILLEIANGLSKSYSNSLWLICYSKRPKYSYKYWQKLKKKERETSALHLRAAHTFCSIQFHRLSLC